MSKSTVTFDCNCFVTDSNKLIDFWEKCSFWLDADLTYRKTGFLRNKISFKIKFDTKKEPDFFYYYKIFKNRYDGACC